MVDRKILMGPASYSPFMKDVPHKRLIRTLITAVRIDLNKCNPIKGFDT